MEAPVVQVKHLTASYEGSVILKDVSFSVQPGTITAILGRSGCGKSTLLKTVLQLHRPDSGRIHFFGQDIGSLDEDEFRSIFNRIGVVFQNGGLLKSVSIGENLSIPLRHHTNLPESLVRRIVTAKLDLVGLHGVEKKLPAELSGGMRKRAAIARALTLDPELLFFDEPSEGLDPVTMKSLDRLIHWLGKRLGTTIILISHQVQSIRRVADRLILISGKGIQFQGDLEEGIRSDIPEMAEFFAGKTGSA